MGSISIGFGDTLGLVLGSCSWQCWGDGMVLGVKCASPTLCRTCLWPFTAPVCIVWKFIVRQGKDRGKLTLNSQSDLHVLIVIHKSFLLD